MTPEEIKEMIIGLRIEFGDTDESNNILQDSEYAYLINKYYDPKNSRKLDQEVTFTFLAKLSQVSVRERVGQEERYGNNAFDNYLKLLEKKLKDPSFGGLMPIAYYGGTYKDEAEYYETDPNFCWSPVYVGSTTGVPTWKGQRIYKVNGVSEPYEVEAKLRNGQAYY